jgi:hypothetical protein
MTESWKAASERFERNDKEIQRRILALPGSEADLKTLVKAGASEREVLQQLSFAVMERGFWREPMRRKKKELESIANQLETVARHAERVSLDPAAYVSPWLAVLAIGEWEHVKTAGDCSPAWIWGWMRWYAQNCRHRAKAFGTLLREHPPREKRQMIDCLLWVVWRSTGRYHDKEVARLLTNAFEAVGSKRYLTVDQIKKHRQKHIVPRIEIYKRLHPNPSTLVDQSGKAGTP